MSKPDGSIVRSNDIIIFKPTSMPFEEIENLTMNMNKLVLNNYLYGCPTFHVKPEFWISHNNPEDDIRYIVDNVDKIYPYTRWKIDCDTYTMYLEVVKNGDNEHILSASVFDAKEQYVIISALIISDVVAISGGGPHLMTLGSHNLGMRRVKEWRSGNNTFNVDFAVRVKLAMKRLIENQSFVREVNCSHSKFEMRVFRKLISRNLNAEGEIINAILAYGDNMFKEDDFASRVPEAVSDGILRYMERQDHINPLIHMENSEWSQVGKYVLDRNEGPMEDLVDIVKHQRFGKELSMQVDGVHGKPVKVDMDIIMNENDDTFLVQMMCDIAKGHTLFVSVMYGNLSSFMIERDIRSLRYDIWTKDGKDILSSLEEYEGLIPDDLHGIGKVQVMVCKLLDVYTVIYDRPRRLSNDELKEDRQNEILKNIIIRRILGPMEFERKKKSDLAKESASKPDKQSKSSSNVEYVTEYWEREGHHRRTPSGGSVWIPACTCRRQLPLTTKKVVLKL